MKRPCTQGIYFYFTLCFVISASVGVVVAAVVVVVVFVVFDVVVFCCCVYLRQFECGRVCVSVVI